MEDRKSFLMIMYQQMFNDIERHHKIVWQTIGVLIGAFAILALVEKQIMPLDIASGLIILLTTWVLGHVYDSNYWYNRNLVIIANIERQFLVKEDQKNIHYYFGAHRDKNSLQTSLRIQKYFCLSVISLIMLYHFIESIYPGFNSDFSFENISFIKTTPYIALILGLIFVNWIKQKRIKNYAEFLSESPGISIDNAGINYGDGHPTTQP